MATELQPAAYNIAINDGPAAGQTVPHLHIHLIPRYTNDESSPRCSNRMRRSWCTSKKYPARDALN